MTDETESQSGTAPTKRMLDWAAAAIGAGARVTKIQPLHGDETPWRLSIEFRGGMLEAVLRTPRRVWQILPSMVATGAAALQFAEQHGLPAPRLIAADLDGDATGATTTLETLAPGSTPWPKRPSAEQLRAAGAVLARVHSVTMAPSKHLPFRPRPIAVDDFAADRRNGRMPTTPLLQAADELIATHGLPAGGTVFVHGDVWPGNIIWNDEALPALIDWKTAGVGAPGVDLGDLRLQVAIAFGPEAPDQVLYGWERANGTKASDVAYWDAVAALNTPTEFDARDGVGATDRRDGFLRAALANLGG